MPHHWHVESCTLALLPAPVSHKDLVGPVTEQAACLGARLLACIGAEEPRTLQFLESSQLTLTWFRASRVLCQSTATFLALGFRVTQGPFVRDPGLLLLGPFVKVPGLLVFLQFQS